MIDEEQFALLVYHHAVQLTLIDYEPEEAFRLACVVAIRAFDPRSARADMDAAREALALAEAKKAGVAKANPPARDVMTGSKEKASTANASNAERTRAERNPVV